MVRLLSFIIYSLGWFNHFAHADFVDFPMTFWVTHGFSWDRIRCSRWRGHSFGMTRFSKSASSIIRPRIHMFTSCLEARQTIIPLLTKNSLPWHLLQTFRFRMITSFQLADFAWGQCVPVEEDRLSADQDCKMVCGRPYRSTKLVLPDSRYYWHHTKSACSDSIPQAISSVIYCLA